jgi:hypothetical protein
MSWRNRVAMGAFVVAAAASPAFPQTLDPEQSKALLAYQDLVYSLSQSANPELDAILKQIRIVLSNVRTELTKDDFELKSAQISLAVGLKVVAGAGVTFLIFTLGPQYSNETTQTLKFTLALPPPDPVAGKLLEADLSHDFTSAILAAAAQAKVAGKNGLELCSFNADMKFAITYTVQGDIKSPLVIVPITADLSGQVNSSNTQEAALTFSKKGNPAECKAGTGGAGG